jgi:hypothetical protein
MLNAVIKVATNLDVFKTRVRQRFDSDLDIAVAARRYTAVLQRLAA